MIIEHTQKGIQNTGYKMKAPPESGALERETRFELATATLATWGSTTELLSQIKKPKIIKRNIPICNKKMC